MSLLTNINKNASTNIAATEVIENLEKTFGRRRICNDNEVWKLKDSYIEWSSAYANFMVLDACYGDKNIPICMPMSCVIQNFYLPTYTSYSNNFTQANGSAWAKVNNIMKDNGATGIKMPSHVINLSRYNVDRNTLKMPIPYMESVEVIDKYHLYICKTAKEDMIYNMNGDCITSLNEEIKANYSIWADDLKSIAPIKVIHDIYLSASSHYIELKPTTYNIESLYINNDSDGTGGAYNILIYNNECTRMISSVNLFKLLYVNRIGPIYDEIVSAFKEFFRLNPNLKDIYIAKDAGVILPWISDGKYPIITSPDEVTYETLRGPKNFYFSIKSVL